ncbi:unnamed protein product [Parascedosporium putredinis]|uniref:tRNA ligase n=2 Tax=Parascedosporium putredinis TaxID=1442378 RepID=A0A9P1GY13_9PEZI|nr:unnamed protein product [Parascedosporium putredinis]CAI7989525.1 unnamed protein product [Parascedosporium putredinis]
MAEPIIPMPQAKQPPKIPQDVSEVASMVKSLDKGRNPTSNGKKSFKVKRNTFEVANSPDDITVDSWKFSDWDYKRRDLPTYARGLFTTRNRRNEPEIAVRGYDKFFNVGEVNETEWKNILEQTRGPTSSPSRRMAASSSSPALRMARYSQDEGALAAELRRRNVTAVAELCDDAFEEHILAYGEDKAGLYLHGMNLNLPVFTTYTSDLVQQFADDWGFRKTGLIVMEDVNEVKNFLEKVAESGAHDGRDVEGFVIRCQRSYNPAATPYQDFFFKVHQGVDFWETSPVQEAQADHGRVSLYARKRLAADPKLGKLYVQNHGIIGLRDDFLAFKQINGADAANFENQTGDGEGSPSIGVDKDVILVPIATIGCGKTTIAQALLETRAAVIADRNNAARMERRQIITDVKLQHPSARLVALHFVHTPDTMDKIREVTQARVIERGDNHQTIHAATDQAKFMHVMEGFLDRFEPCNAFSPPDDGFDHVIDLNPLVDSRQNLEVVVKQLHQWYPSLVKDMPSAERLDEAIVAAMGYKPDIKHTIPDRGGKSKPFGRGGQAQQQQQDRQEKKPLEYMAVHLPTREVNDILEKAFVGQPPEAAKFYRQLKQTRRVQAKFHVTLIHRASAKQHPELWKKYNDLYEEAEKAGSGQNKLGECDVMLERIVFDDRVMTFVARLINDEWKTSNTVAHVTIGTRDSSVKPKESNDLLAKWLEDGAGDGKIHDVVLEDKPTLKGPVRPPPRHAPGPAHPLVHGPSALDAPAAFFQHNNLTAVEWIAVRRELKTALAAVAPPLQQQQQQQLGEGQHVDLAPHVRLEVLRSRMFDVAMKIDEFFDPALAARDPATPRTDRHGPLADGKGIDPANSTYAQLSPLMSGPVAALVFPAVSPPHLAAALSVLAPTPGLFPAPPKKKNPGYYDPVVQAALAKLLLVGGRVEGKVFDVDGIKWVGGIDGGLDGLRARLVAMLQGVGLGLTNTLESGSKSLWLSLEGRKLQLEEEQKGEQKQES